MNRSFDGDRLDVADLLQRMPDGSSLSINTIRKKDMRRLKGLDRLPLSTLALRWLSAPDLTSVPLIAVNVAELNLDYTAKRPQKP